VCGTVTSLSLFALFEPIPNRPPVAEAGPDQIEEARGPGGATVLLDGSSSSDPDGDRLVYAWQGSFGTVSGRTVSVTLPLGAHTITLNIDDGRGGTASDTVIVTVRDTVPPGIRSVAASPATLWPPNRQMVRVSVDAVVTDAMKQAPRCAIQNVGSNEPVDELGDGDTAPDWLISGPLSVTLRAERAGPRRGW
jgi:hypothetical protein